ncbi:cation transporter, partial [Endozoicomonas sp.]|uniref:cation transporter n=1 Tax=Endozoicomonas sp. TaxID=1892382 RepID=UPI00383AE062
TATIFLMLYRSRPSPLIHFEFQEWLVDASLSASATIAFTVAYLMGNSHPVTPYIDSALTLLLLLFLIRLPLKTLHKNYKQLLLQDLAEPGLVQRVKETISEQHRAIANQHINISMIWLGRWLWVNINITVDNDLPPTTGEMKAIRTTVATAIRSVSRYHRIELSLDFPENG